MPRKLTKKEKGFVTEYLKTGNGTLSALKNYEIESEHPANVAAAIASENLRKPKIAQAIAEALPDGLLAEKHLALLNKKEVVTKNNVTTGEVDVIATGEIDVQAVAKGLDMAYKLKGTYAPEKSVNLNMRIDAEVQEKANEAIRNFLNGQRDN